MQRCQILSLGVYKKISQSLVDYIAMYFIQLPELVVIPHNPLLVVGMTVVSNVEPERDVKMQ